MGKLIDQTGKIYGRLLVLRRADVIGNEASWICKCECGNETTVVGGNLKKGYTTSCGCYHREKLSERLTTHGMTDTPEYKAWCEMKSRCFSPSNTSYLNYGGRGITVHLDWIESFENFYSYIGSKPTPEHSVERMNVNGNYEPGNVCWATQFEQARNKRNNTFLEYKGEVKIIQDIIRDTGEPATTLRRHISNGKTLEETLIYLESRK